MVEDSAPDTPEHDRKPESGGEISRHADVSGDGRDVFLNVPLLKVEEISLEVDNLDAHVALNAAVLDLLKLNVGADVYLGKVKLEIKGVEAQALLEVRLHNVASIVNRVLTTLDRNPEILDRIGRGVESAARDVGRGAGEAAGEIGRGAGGAVEDVGRGAGGAVEDVGRGAGGAVEDVGRGAGGAVEDVGRGASGAVEGVGKGAGSAVQDVGHGAGGAVEDVGRGAGGAVQDVGEGASGALNGAGRAAEGAGNAVGGATGRGRNGRRPEPEAETDGDQARRPDAGAATETGANGLRQNEISELHSAFRETEESVRELGRALLRLNPIGGSARGGK